MFFFLKFAIVLGGRGRQLCYKSFEVVIGNWGKNFDKQIVFAVHQCHSHSGPSELEARNKIYAYPPHTHTPAFTFRHQLMTMCASFWQCAPLRKYRVVSRQSQAALIINCHIHSNVTKT